MITTDKIELAKQLSRHFHKGQKYGEHDYYEYHILGVLKTLHRVSKEYPTEEMAIVALLHDVLEDTECTWDTIQNIFCRDIADYVSCLSYIKGYDKEQYLKDVSIYPVTRVVKYADSLFNYNECIKDGNLERAKKYKYNLDVLYSKELFKNED